MILDRQITADELCTVLWKAKIGAGGGNNVKLRVQCEGQDFIRYLETHSIFIDGKLVCSWKVPDSGKEGKE